MARAPEIELTEEFFGPLDRASGATPLYVQIARRLEAAIAAGDLAAGTRLENEVSMAKRLGLSRPTIRQAIQDLVDKGMLVRRRGVGTQVLQRPVARAVDLTSLNEDLEKSGNKPATTVLSHQVMAADRDTADHLGVAEGAPTLHLRRLRLIGATPLALLHNILPEPFTDITAGELVTTGLYETLRARGVVFSVAHQRIGARAAASDEADLLDTPAEAPLLTMQRTALDNSGAIVEWGDHCYRPDLYSFETTLVAR
ncbi:MULTISPECIES: GntR family transcriptional regulator [Brevibacterium]|jgi:DNA-binding GntR family transcriptional regulator|uniref:GntR family transcriptional regulator n=1 Tax=Brevibacterium casei TaxID=33889 RepID=A0A7T3ZZX3_9MICO|nr:MULTISPECIES: GntR family transcriptional regulator [Brevibacterium]QQB14665.1 GntR family transcriptional regulator [Brevibacterium casei]